MSWEVVFLEVTPDVNYPDIGGARLLRTCSGEHSEAARLLNQSKAAIRTHLEGIYRKLKVTNRVAAVTEGIRKGLIPV